MATAAVNDVLRELYANASISDQTTYYANPVTQEYYKKISAIINAVVIRTNFSFAVGSRYVMDISPILRYGSIPCSTPEKEAFMDSDISCAIFQLPYFLEKIQFGYLCGIVIIPIMLISVFGKIKESYRWFLLHQAIWDAFMCYSFICERPTLAAWGGGNIRKFQTCFYSQQSSNQLLEGIFVILRGSFKSAPYIPLFLLAFSRCLSLYFPNFYQRNNKTWKILIFIIAFDVIIMIVGVFPLLLQNITTYLKSLAYQRCFNDFCTEYNNYTNDSSQCSMKNVKHYQCISQWSAYYDKFKINYQHTQISVTPIMFVFVVICILLLFIKISVQLKYQLKHNRYAFMKTIKVVAIIFIQSITLSIYLFITTIQSYLQFMALGEFITDTTVYQKIPPGIFVLQNFATTTSINIIRIFFDSFIVITVLSGYRKRIFKFFAFFFFKIKKFFRRNGNNNIIKITSTTAVKHTRHQ